MPNRDGSKTAVVEYFGDGDHTFDLVDKEWKLISDLEQKVGNLLPALHRIRGGDFSAMELRHVLRTGLIGGGKSPSEAEALVKTWFDMHPLTECLHIAMAITGAALFGTVEEEPAPAAPDPVAEAVARLEAEAADDPA